jgi:hypothetical protein
MKAPKTTVPTVTLSVLMDAYTLTDDDCFGKEWDLNDKSCSMCSMQGICMILKTQTVKKQGDLLGVEFGPFVDTIDFEDVPTTSILEALKAQSYSMEDLRIVFAEFSKCKDEHTVAIKVNQFIRNNKLTLTNGFISNNN